jgi:hypothetical protein
MSSTSTVRGWETLPAYTPKAGRSASRKPPAPTPAAAAPAPAAAGGETWKMTLKTPMGLQDMTLQIVRDGATFTGRIDSAMGSEVVDNGKIAGDALSWTMDLKKPTAIKLSFEVKLQGDVMTGHAKLGMFGKADLKGTRA